MWYFVDAFVFLFHPILIDETTEKLRTNNDISRHKNKQQRQEQKNGQQKQFWFFNFLSWFCMATKMPGPDTDIPWV